MTLELRNLYGEINACQTVLSLKRLGWSDRVERTFKGDRDTPLSSLDFYADEQSAGRFIHCVRGTSAERQARSSTGASPSAQRAGAKRNAPEPLLHAAAPTGGTTADRVTLDLERRVNGVPVAQASLEVSTPNAIET